MGLVQTITGVVFATLFAIAIISFGIGFANDNETGINIEDNSNLDKSSFETDVRTFEGNSNSSSVIFGESSIAKGDENVEGGGQFKVSRKGVVDSTKSMVTMANKEIFGDDVGFGVIGTAFISLFILIIGLYAWKAWRGNPD